jgi:hypothetical protein
MAILCQIPYRPRLLMRLPLVKTLLTFLLFGFFLYSITRVFNVHSFTEIAVVFWGGAVINAVSSVLIVFVIFRRMLWTLRPRYLKLEEDLIVIPYGFLQVLEQHIRYEEILNVIERSDAELDGMEIQTTTTKRSISKQLLPNDKSYQQLKDLLLLKTKWD